jgi:hypothetical protein
LQTVITQSISDAAIAITRASTVALEFLFLATTCLSSYPILAFASLTYLDWANYTNCHFNTFFLRRQHDGGRHHAGAVAVKTLAATAMTGDLLQLMWKLRRIDSTCLIIDLTYFFPK